jgi:hypothetical protein
VLLLVRSGLQNDAGRGDLLRPDADRPTRHARRPVPVKRRRFYRLRAGETLSDVAIKFEHDRRAAAGAATPGIEPTNLIGRPARPCEIDVDAAA